VFFLGVLTPEQAAERLSRQAELAAERHQTLVDLKAAVDWGDDMLSVNGILALEYGLRLRAMEEEWARWAVERLSEGPK
jgi:PadR family transcriptional regulator AphA